METTLPGAGKSRTMDENYAVSGTRFVAPGGAPVKFAGRFSM
jgi:hypothetical protein